MIQAVFFDIDGTLVTRKNHVLASTQKAIQILKENGHKIGIATSRGPNQLPKEVSELPIDFYVCFNGQYIIDQCYHRLYCHPLEEKILHKVKQYQKAQHIQGIWQEVEEEKGSLFMRFAQSSVFLPLIHQMKRYIPNVVLQGCYQLRRGAPATVPKIQGKIYQITLLQPQSEDESLQKEVKEATITRSNPFTVEIIQKGHSKKRGIEEVLHAHQMGLEHLLFFGDSYNDLEVMKSKAIGVAMGNGIPELKEVCDYVTKHHDEHGIYHALEHFGLLEKRRDEE